MSRKYFGTDGVRGVANSGLTPEFVFQLGRAAGTVLQKNGENPSVVIGRDTRRSGTMLGAALASGFCSAGVCVTTLGVAPTGAISYAVRSSEFSLGAVISASHNPAPDNGIKLLQSSGLKVSDDFELEIESLLSTLPDPLPTGDKVGEIFSDRSVLDSYCEMLEAIVPEGLHGLKVALDCSHGAGYELAPRVLQNLGADVVLAGVYPDGSNINAEGGATKPNTVMRICVEQGCDIGIALDGDADRAVFSDRNGHLVNGDQTMAIWMAHWKKQPPVVVGTVMSNGGFASGLAQHGIELSRAPVGDKYVKQRMDELGAPLGGEQSGHLIFPERGPTGDGLITMLELLRVMKITGKPLHELRVYENWPQKLVNLRDVELQGWQQNANITDALARAEEQLGESGRLNLRASGTQPILRLMVEATVEKVRDEVTQFLVQVLLSELGGTIYSEVDLTHALGD